MSKIPVGLQLYSLRNEAQADFFGTLKLVKEMGYDGVEFAGLFGNSPVEIKKYADSIGLSLVSAHIPFADLVNNTEGVIDECLALGLKYAVVPYMTEEYRPGGEKFFEAVELIGKLGESFKAKGITLLYHNHDFEFKKVNGEYGLDYMYRTVSEELLKTELDTCWVRVAGEDPAEYINKYSGRAPIVHLKDYFKSSDKDSGSMYELIGIKTEKKETSTFEFRSCGNGCQNIEALIKASENAGTKWLIVEQDKPTPGKTPSECVKSSIDYIREIYK
ncbi:MAG: sugar phosphate isomerase/epimerase [Ruminococcaceae bacterium]|nr:sugar phosphate isomerase/epimerase [Oscillospiraceae bacterium]